MLLSIFSSLYELVIGENSDYPEYREGVFDSVGLISFIIAFVICLIFYAGLGRWKPIFHKLMHWIITLIIVAGIGFGLAYMQAKDLLDSVDGYLIRFALFNAVYSAIYFIIFSLFFRKISVFAKRTPF